MIDAPNSRVSAVDSMLGDLTAFCASLLSLGDVIAAGALGMSPFYLILIEDSEFRHPPGSRKMTSHCHDVSSLLLSSCHIRSKACRASCLLPPASKVSLSSGWRGSGSEPLLHLPVSNQACLLEDSLATGEHHKVWDAAYSEAGGELRMSFCIYLEDESFARHSLRCLRDFRRCGAAGSTPGCPEVYEDGHGRVLDDLVEEGGVDGKGLGKWWQRNLAGSATTGPAEIAGCDTILLLAVIAGADGRHRDPQAV